MHLAAFARRVTLLVRDGALAASMSQYLLERIQSEPNVEILYNVEVSALDGDHVLRRIQLRRRPDQVTTWRDTSRLFVAIGGEPHTKWAKDTPIIRDRAGYLLTGPDLLDAGRSPECWPLDQAPYYLETSVPGSFAAGDVRHRSVKRVATAVGEGAMAVAFVHRYLEETA
jgi:thioredoxin reductase (NADPH)